jgi:hypothetical protein
MEDCRTVNTQEESNTKARLPYHPPSMVDYGEVAVLTHGNV